MSPETSKTASESAPAARAATAAPTSGAVAPSKKKLGPKTLTRVAAASDVEAKRRAGVVLEVLAGVRSTTDAATALSVTLPRYYALEAGAIEGLVRACDPTRRGPGRSQSKEIDALRREKARLERECARMAALARVTQRTLGLAPSTPAARATATVSDPSGKPSSEKGSKRRRRPVARALVAAKVLARPGAPLPARAEPVRPTAAPAATKPAGTPTSARASS